MSNLKFFRWSQILGSSNFFKFEFQLFDFYIYYNVFYIYFDVFYIYFNICYIWLVQPLKYAGAVGLDRLGHLPSLASPARKLALQALLSGATAAAGCCSGSISPPKNVKVILKM